MAEKESKPVTRTLNETRKIAYSGFEMFSKANKKKLEKLTDEERRDLYEDLSNEEKLKYKFEGMHKWAQILHDRVTERESRLVMKDDEIAAGKRRERNLVDELSKLKLGMKDTKS